MRLLRYDHLEKAFVRLRRSFVAEGRWAKLWREDRGASLSAAPLLALLAKNTGVVSECDLNWLSIHSGVTKAALQRARLSLMHAQAVSFRKGPRRGRWCFELGSVLVPARREPSFYFPGYLVSSGLWAELPPEARNLLVVLAACAKAQLRADSIDPFTEVLPSEAVDTLYDLDLVEESYDEKLVSVELVRRVGRTDFAELEGLSGLNTPEVSAMMLSITENSHAQKSLVVVLDVSDGIWYHLPWWWWQLD